MNKFAIILGEPNSINSEILEKSLVQKRKVLLIGSYNLFKKQLTILKKKIFIKKITSFEEYSKKTKGFTILDVPLKFKKPFEVNSEESAKYIFNCFDVAHDLSVRGLIKGFINCPVNKRRLFKNKKLGITEYLAKKNKIYNSEVMMIFNKKLSVVPLTTHIKIKNVSKNLNKKEMIKKLLILNSFYIKYFQKKPKIGILGLNPHNHEFRKDSEEIKVIIPIINILKKRIKITGPLSADTIFQKNNRYKFDIIVGMYHDQVLAPFKAIFGFEAVNVTLGLPYLRLSPDHGTAEDKIKMNKATARSLNMCIELMTSIKKS